MTHDPFDAATNAGNQSPVYFGKVEVYASFVALIKGRGKVDFDESTHPADQRRTNVHFIINPIDAMNVNMIYERNVLAESRQWRAVVWASLRELGLKNVRDLNGKYVKFEFVKTGRTWKGRNGLQEETTFKFLELYETEAEAAAAFNAGKAHTSADDDEQDDADPAMAVDMSPAAGPGQNGAKPPANDGERETAMAFLPALVKSAAGDMTVLANLLAQTPLVKNHFTINSPEVQMLIPEVA